MKKFIFGALIGAGIALLYAPETGARTRSLLRDKSNRLKNDMTDFMDSKKRHIANKTEGYKAKARRWADDIKEKMSHDDAEMHESEMASHGAANI